MENTVFNYSGTTSFDTSYTITDIFSKSITLNPGSVTTNSSWFDTVLLSNGRKLEELSYTLYNNPNLWDVLFIINDMDTVFDLPKEDDYVYAVVEDRLAKWLLIFPNTTSVRQDELRAQFLVEETANNEKHRNFRVLLPQYMSRFRELLNVSA